MIFFLAFCSSFYLTYLFLFCPCSITFNNFLFLLEMIFLEIWANSFCSFFLFLRSFFFSYMISYLSYFYSLISCLFSCVGCSPLSSLYLWGIYLSWSFSSQKGEIWAGNSFTSCQYYLTFNSLLKFMQSYTHWGWIYSFVFTDAILSFSLSVITWVIAWFLASNS